jgi:hypothetical protein
MEAGMEHRYYLLKTFTIAMAIATAAFTGGIGTAHMEHAISHARYGASAEVQAAAWRVTAYLARGAAHLAGLGATLSP